MRVYDAVTELTRTIGRLKEIQVRYPDVDIYKDSFGRIFPHSKIVNSEVRNFSIAQGSNIGKNTIMQAWVEFQWRGEIVKVYASVEGSPFIKIAKVDQDGFEKMDPNIESTMRNAGMNGFAIDKIRMHAQEVKKSYEEFMRDDEAEAEIERIKNEAWFNRLRSIMNPTQKGEEHEETIEQDQGTTSEYKEQETGETGEAC